MRKDYTIKTDDTGREVVSIKRTPTSYCQVCARDFDSPELVYWVNLDGNTVCEKCSRIHKDRELRIYVKEE